MLLKMLRALILRLAPPSTPDVVYGTRPGYVWWSEQNCWVDEAESYKPTGRRYALLGPVYSATHGHP